MMTESRIERVWLMNSITWQVKGLFACEVVVKALKKDKNNISQVR